MKTAKYTRFGINYTDDKKAHVYNYVAYDDRNGTVLALSKHLTWSSDIPYSIGTTCSSNFETGGSHETITAEEFWKVYKAVTVALFRYHVDHLHSVKSTPLIEASNE